MLKYIEEEGEEEGEEEEEEGGEEEGWEEDRGIVLSQIKGSAIRKLLKSCLNLVN